ncbi:MAG TPA: ABC transporter permease [Pyrinomonadaceae bacterium]|nr:ABC transporter permease [Pyrinomonadaceae bacterium]
MITLLRLELLKLARSKAFYLSFSALSGFVLLMLWGFYSYAQHKTSGLATEQFKYTYESKSYFNGLTFTLYSLMFAYSLVIPIFVTMTAGGQIAGERRAGTLRMICIRPISRASLVLAKFIVVAIHTYLLVAFFIALNLLVGLLFVGWGDLALYPGPLNLVDAPGQILRDDALWRFFYASFSGSWALLVVAAIAMLLSTIFDNPVTAVATTLAVYLTLYIVGRIEFFETLRPYFFTTDMDFWRDVLKPKVPWPDLYHYSATCGAYIFGILLTAVLLFERKDITS